MDIELKPCPLCGDIPRVQYDDESPPELPCIIVCDCGLVLYNKEVVWFPDVETATNNWNKRYDNCS
jgi:hypothetical protein